jgi:hypothetical protein
MILYCAPLGFACFDFPGWALNRFGAGKSTAIEMLTGLLVPSQEDNLSSLLITACACR